LGYGPNALPLRQFAFVCVSPVGFSCTNIKDTVQALNIFFFLKLLITVSFFTRFFPI